MNEPHDEKFAVAKAITVLLAVFLMLYVTPHDLLVTGTSLFGYSHSD